MDKTPALLFILLGISIVIGCLIRLYNEQNTFLWSFLVFGSISLGIGLRAIRIINLERDEI